MRDLLKINYPVICGSRIVREGPVVDHRQTPQTSRYAGKARTGTIKVSLEIRVQL